MRSPSRHCKRKTDFPQFSQSRRECNIRCSQVVCQVFTLSPSRTEVYSQLYVGWVGERSGRSRIEFATAGRYAVTVPPSRCATRHPPKDNDVDDWLLLHVLPYADLVLTDRAFAEVIHFADRTLTERVLSAPVDAARRLEASLL